MKLYGQEVPQSVIDAANAARVGREKVNVFYEIWEPSAKGFSRLSGKIRFEGGYWHEVV